MTVRFTNHARLRMAAMGVTTKRVKRALRHPAMEYRGSHEHPDGRRVVVSDDLAIVLTDDYTTVVTVLWHSKEGRDETHAATPTVDQDAGTQRRTTPRRVRGAAPRPQPVPRT